jgi:uncharacterized protein YndB with AHSA1/START domain
MPNLHKLTIVPRGERELVFTRVFEAPRDRVFEALTSPEQLQRWLLGPPGWSMPVCEVDPRPGGAYRFLWRSDADGTEMGMRGTYREVAAPARLVNTECFDQPWYPGEALLTTVLTEAGGKTTLTATLRYESQEARDMVQASPMEDGAAISYDRMEALLAAPLPALSKAG